MIIQTGHPPDLERLIAELSEPGALGPGARRVEIRQTHISVVFLTGEDAFKIKKPVALGFLDFSTLERRRHSCREEVRLNRRLAPGVYRGVVPIVEDADGRLRIGSEPEEEGAVEWAVRMRRLPDEATLLARLRAGELQPAMLRALARRLARFHARAPRSARIAHFGTWGVIERNAAENFAQSAGLVGTTLSRQVHDRLAALTQAELERHRRVIAERAQRGVPCETHGDLHLDHVYAFPDREPPEDLVVIDCIEFNERFRHADPIADVAFLAMDLRFYWRGDLADAFTEAYIRAAGDEEGRRLLPFYVAYRAAVRAKVAGFELDEAEIPDDERRDALRRARAHWLLALGALERPGRRPCLLLVGGLPGTGKTTLAHGLARAAGFRVIRSDVVRKELAGVAPDASDPSRFEEGIYTPAFTERTYAECLRRAEEALFAGERVVVDATFRERARREAFADAARALGVPSAFAVTTASAGVVRDRLARRERDASDADWAIHCDVAQRWERPRPRAVCPWRAITTRGGPGAAVARALAWLAELGLHGGPTRAERAP